MVNEVVNEAIAESVLEIETDSAVAITSKTDVFYKDEINIIPTILSYSRINFL